MTYSVAIRTLGTSGDALRRELISLHRQSLQPEKIIIYIAKGYAIPGFRVGIEQYVYVDKGMVSQRALNYDEISSDCILLLDDDVELSPDSAAILLTQMEENDADCVAVDTFANHNMSLLSKIKAAMSGLVFPRFDQKWAFRLHSNGSFSYVNNPKRGIYPSQSAAGPCSLWRKKSLLSIRLKDELWLDRMGFAYGDDDLEFYKLYINGGRLFVSFNAGVKNLDSKTSSSAFHQDEKKFYIRAKSNFIRWYRMHYEHKSTFAQNISILSFTIKNLWLALIHIILSFATFNANPIKRFCRGLSDGYKFVKSDEYKKIPPYKNENFILR